MFGSSRLQRWVRSGVLAIGLAVAGTGLAQSPAPDDWPEGGTEVDVALVLAVDVSYSMDLEELALQRDGYIAALNSPVVLDAIRRGMIGRIGVTYIEWAGVGTRNVVADWTIIEDAASARAFTDRLQNAPVQRARRTSIAGAINFSMERLLAAKLRPIRRVIDISGDGPNNEGGPVTIARDRALRAGVIINGLPIQLKRGYFSAFDINALDEYYADCVIGGPGSFMNVITERDQFREAIRLKILREVAQSSQSDAGGPGQPGRSNCMIGEQQWRQNWDRN
ncbi:MAG: hypothetical protein FD175_622 [Beijerinckiaceae bacterium]|nr:MAG: hypothetical protein FD175_622 [Beijerinckiaceae bacterium]